MRQNMLGSSEVLQFQKGFPLKTSLSFMAASFPFSIAVYCIQALLVYSIHTELTCLTLRSGV